MLQEKQAFRQAETLFNHGQIAQAAAICQQLLKTNPRQAEAMALLGLIALKEGNPAAAESFLAKAAKQHPGHAPFQLLLGKAQLLGGQSAKAAQSFTKASRLSQKSPAVLQQIADSYAIAGRYADAERHYQSIAGNQNPVVLNNLATAQWRQGKLENALEHFTTAAELAPETPDPTFNRAELLLATGKVAEAEASCLEAMRRFTQHPRGYSILARIALTREQFETALQCADQALAVAAGFPPALLCRGLALGQLKETTRALECFEAALACSSPESAEYQEAMLHRGILLERLNRLDEAREMAETASRLKMHSPLLLMLQAKLAQRSGELSTASQLTRQAIRMLGDAQAALIAELYYLLADLEEKQASYDTALAAVEQAKTIERQQLGLADQEARQHLEAIDGYRRWLQTPAASSSIPTWEPIQDGLPEPVFLFGFPRSGTTLLEQALYTSPRVQVGNEGSFIARLVGAFQQARPGGRSLPDALAEIDEATVCQLRALYWQEVGTAFPLTTDRLFIDKHPLQCVHLALLQRIFPRSKTLFLLRDPRDACTSCYLRGISTSMLRRQFNTLEGTASLYARVMELLAVQQQTLPLQMHLLRYEDMVHDFRTEIQKVCAFIELEFSEEMLRFYEARYQRSAATPSYDSISQPVYDRAIGRWRHFERAFADALPILAPYVEQFGYADATSA